MASPFAFDLSPDINAAALREHFNAEGWVQVMPFLHPTHAAILRSDLLRRDDWHEIINSGEKVFELDRAAQKAMSPETRARLEQAVNNGARSGFQFRFENIRVPDEHEPKRDDPTHLNSFALFMNSEPVLSLFRSITGTSGINLADAQATAYRAGDLLTSHDDEVEGKHREAAYVFGLTETWDPDWGGLLMLEGENGDIRQGLLPRFNCLTMFKVPQRHSVSYVPPFVPYVRLSITGWLRSIPA
jgi:Rps23 Pro-64 3,4-dihydroxylase Tpa1-like proline 4-hydroxylase